MRNRDYFLPSVTTLILAGMVWFLSCSHQNRLREDENTAFDQVEEQQLAEGPESAEISNSDQSTESNNSDLAQAPSDNSDWSSAPESSQESESSFNSQQAPAPEQASAPEQAPSPSAELNEEQAAPSEPPPQAFSQPETMDAEVQMEEVPAPRVRKSFTAKIPKIPTKSFTRSGAQLNRFYFARKGDSPLKASQLIYSNSKLAKKLARWNGKVWAPGQVIFYSSPVDPQDMTMVSFYEERNIQPEEYEVKNGDWLTRIAHKKLGSMKSWKEIAVLNQLKTPGSIEVGQALAIYPKNLFKALQTSAQQKQAKLEKPQAPAVVAPRNEPFLAKPSEPAPVFESKSPESAPQISPPPVVTPPPAVQAPVAQEPQAEEAQDEGVNQAEQVSPAMNWDQLMEQNSIAILIGAALIILLLALAARKKRLKMRGSASARASDSDSTEDTPSKFGRR